MIDSPVLPMLATTAQPFDSEDHVFEVKWDGVRALTAVTAERWHVWGRGAADYTSRYPELEVVRRLPSETMLDGEFVVLCDGVPDLAALLRRHPLVRPERIRHASRLTPVNYVVFDLLKLRGRSLLAEPLHRRRAALAELVNEVGEPMLIYSDGVVGPGRDFFTEVVRQGHEGVVAKQLASRYTPGKRSPAWRKIKPAQVVPCVIVGYVVDRQKVQSLVVGNVWETRLSYAATLTRGVARWPRLIQQLAGLRRSTPAVVCPHRAVWVEPVLYCRVRFRRRTGDGRLQDAAFAGLLDGTSVPASAAEP